MNALAIQPANAASAAAAASTAPDGADFTRANAEMVRWFEQHLRDGRKEIR